MAPDFQSQISFKYDGPRPNLLLCWHEEGQGQLHLSEIL